MIGELLSAGSNLLGSYLSSESARDARRDQQKATDLSVTVQRDNNAQQREMYAPAQQVGYNALSALASELGLSKPGGYETLEQIRARLKSQYPDGSKNGYDDMAVERLALSEFNQQLQKAGQYNPRSAADLSAEVMADPGYQFGLDQGMQALDRRIAAMGGRVSGAALKAANRYGTDYASTGYGAAYQRRQDTLNRLASLAGMGQTATGASAAAGSNSTNAISQALMSQGDANAASRIAQGNIWGNALGQFGAYMARNQNNQGGSFGRYLDPFFSGNGGSGD